MIIILSDDKEQQVGKKLNESLKKRNEAVKYVSLSNLKISTCYNCAGCKKKEYGRCVLQDDMQQVLYDMAHADKSVWVGPVSFGSYSSQIKKAIDRSAILGDMHYYVVNGEMVKGMKAAEGGFWAIGIKSNCSEKEKKLFLHLTEENVKIMNTNGKGFVVEEIPSEEEIEKWWR